MRAFMNGRIDLSQAESIADLIASPENEAFQKSSSSTAERWHFRRFLF